MRKDCPLNNLMEMLFGNCKILLLVIPVSRELELEVLTDSRPSFASPRTSFIPSSIKVPVAA